VTTLHQVGDALKAERIAAKARKIKKPQVSAKEGTSSHKIQRTTLEGTAYCVIERPLRGVTKSR
jgi:hypothetical protein